jgi:hypothetical protein
MYSSPPISSTEPAAGQNDSTVLAAKPSAPPISRRRLRMSRATLLWMLAIYAVAHLALAIGIDWWNPRMTDRVWVKKFKRLRELAREEPDRPLLVMLGSSRTEGEFDASRLNGLPGPDGKPLVAYNAGVPAAGFLHELMYLQEMLKVGVHPKFLLVEFLPPLLNTPRRGFTSEEGWIDACWLTPRDLSRFWPYLDRPERMRRHWLESRGVPWHTYRYDLNTRFRRTIGIEGRAVPRPHDRWGQLATFPELNDYPNRQRIAREMYQESLKHFEVGKGPVKAARHLLELCRKERIPVCFVLLPESREFREWYSPKATEETHAVLEKLKADYGVGVIDATHWLSDDMFFDGHHPTHAGATAFTKRLIVQMRPLLSGGTPAPLVKAE